MSLDTLQAMADPPQHQAIEALAGLLLARGQCDTKTIERGRRVAADSGQRLDHVLLQLGLVTERELAEAYAALLGIGVAGPGRYGLEAPLLPERLGAKFLRDARTLPVAIENDVLVLAAADPLDRFAPAAIATATGYAVALEVAVPIELEAAFGRLYPDPSADSDGAADPVETEGLQPLEEDAERLKDIASEAPVIRLVNQIITRAVETQASDIHVEPFEDRLRVRYRYDGVLHEADSPPVRLTAAIISRIKIMAALDIAERRLPQDGRIKLAVRGQTIDFRVSTIPSLHGETVVLRVLDRATVEFDYAKLGLPAAVIERLTACLKLPNGVVLVTGPTGSGKTTTLYTGLLALNSTTRKIVTLEDPIEYQLRGINQTQVKRQIGLTFQSLLPHVLRQDPNVIMLGEIRDPETAQMAAQAALTGHLVLSTLHTNSAAATITRLRDMGLEDYLITAVLRGVLAQRLVRRLCTACRRPAPVPAELAERFDLQRRCQGGPVSLWHAEGCPECRQTGYRGRLSIAEFLVVDAAIERLIIARADHNAIERSAVEAGMLPIFDVGLAAALAGITTLEEVLRSARQQD
jgi:general secretion pathway protein E